MGMKINVEDMEIHAKLEYVALNFMLSYIFLLLHARDVLGFDLPHFMCHSVL
jgi:hypothetical protein